MYSDSANTLVFYTVDGSRPQPHPPNKKNSHAVSFGKTFSYHAPFTLGAGKVSHTACFEYVLYIFILKFVCAEQM